MLAELKKELKELTRANLRRDGKPRTDATPEAMGEIEVLRAEVQVLEQQAADKVDLREGHVYKYVADEVWFIVTALTGKLVQVVVYSGISPMPILTKSFEELRRRSEEYTRENVESLVRAGKWVYNRSAAAQWEAEGK